MKPLTMGLTGSFGFRIVSDLKLSPFQGGFFLRFSQRSTLGTPA